MKKQLSILMFILLLFSSCTTIYQNIVGPNLKFKYDGEYTGIDSLVFIHGYFQSLNTLSEPDENRYIGIMFYPNGILCRVASSNPSSAFSGVEGYKPTAWGNYTISNDTIKVQYINNYGMDGGMVVGHFSYLINSYTEIKELARDKKEANVILRFHPLDNRIGFDNWLLKKKWFYKKE